MNVFGGFCLIDVVRPMVSSSSSSSRAAAAAAAAVADAVIQQ